MENITKILAKKLIAHGAELFKEVNETRTKFVIKNTRTNYRASIYIAKNQDESDTSFTGLITAYITDHNIPTINTSKVSV